MIHVFTTYVSGKLTIPVLVLFASENPHTNRIDGLSSRPLSRKGSPDLHRAAHNPSMVAIQCYIIQCLRVFSVVSSTCFLLQSTANNRRERESTPDTSDRCSQGGTSTCTLYITRVELDADRVDRNSHYQRKQTSVCSLYCRSDLTLSWLCRS